MILWFPNKNGNDQDLSVYIYSCRAALSVFKMILNSNINHPSMKRIETVLKSKNVLDFTNKDRFSILSVIQCYESSLVCYYDEKSCRCYYEVPKIIKCPNTTNSLQFVIRLIEFGNDLIPPTNWIRHSYNKFCKLYDSGGKQQ